MVTSDKIKALIRVLENGKVMVRDFNETGFEMFPDLDSAFNYVKSQLIKEETLKKEK